MSGGGWDLEEIRRRADIVELISPHVRLRKAGRRMSGLCPFHQERTPSFTVDAEKGLWHCFGCKAGGDVFRFVELMEKVSFQEAVELLARRLGLPPRTRAAAAQGRVRERLLSLHEQAARFFHANLKGRAGAQALSYLRGRGMSAESLETFLLGYALDEWDALLAAMQRNGFSGRELARAGLAVARDDGGFYDRFRHRVIFPIRDATGRVIAFGGRSLSEEQQPKYLNSPETALFQKGQTLWAFDRARRAMSESGRAIAVEGYMDAIACHEAGFSETVATMGTALTSGHVDLLRRRADRLLLAFDSDSAGLAAALRSAELFRQAELEVRVVALPDDTDPDSFVRKRGPAPLKELVEAAVPMIEWELGRILARGASKDAHTRMEVLREAVSILAGLTPGVEREYYVGWLAQATASDPGRLRSAEDAIREELARRPARRVAGTRRTTQTLAAGSPGSRPAARTPPAGRLFSSVLAALVQHGELAPEYVRMLERDDFPDSDQQEVFEGIVRLVQQGSPLTAQSVLGEVGVESRALLAQLALEEVPEDRVEEFLRGAVRRLVEARLRRRQRELQQRLSQDLSEEEREAVRQELAQVLRRRSELAGERIVGGG